MAYARIVNGEIVRGPPPPRTAAAGAGGAPRRGAPTAARPRPGDDEVTADWDWRSVVTGRRVLGALAAAFALKLSGVFWPAVLCVIIVVFVSSGGAGCRVASIIAHCSCGLLSLSRAQIFTNLGSKQAGDSSAYSVYNGFRALPGAFTAEQFEVRAAGAAVVPVCCVW
jgi:hypothetical protein